MWTVPDPAGENLPPPPTIPRQQMLPWRRATTDMNTSPGPDDQSGKPLKMARGKTREQAARTACRRVVGHLRSGSLEAIEVSIATPGQPTSQELGSAGHGLDSVPQVTVFSKPETGRRRAVCGPLRPACRRLRFDHLCGDQGRPARSEPHRAAPLPPAGPPHHHPLRRLLPVNCVERTTGRVASARSASRSCARRRSAGSC